MPRPAVVIFLLFIPLASPLAAQEAPPSSPDTVAAEYPPWEQSVYYRSQRGADARRAAWLLQAEPASPGTAAALLRQSRFSDALRVLQRIVETRPGALAEGLRPFAEPFPTSSTEDYARYRAAMPGVLATVRAKARELAGESAAWVLYEALRVEFLVTPRDAASRSLAPDRLKAFAREHEGTEAAREAELIVVGSTARGAGYEAALDAFVRRHPGTCASAHALHAKASSLAHNTPRSADGPGDPTPRLLEAIAISEELKRMALPGCRWSTAEGPSWPGFSIFIDPRAKPARANLERLIERLWSLSAQPQPMAQPDPLGNGIGWVVAGSLPELYRLLDVANGEAQFERRFEEETRKAKDPDAFRYVLARFYMERMRRAGDRQALSGSNEPETPPEVYAKKAREVLVGLHSSGRGIWSRKALATLANLLDYQEDHAAARDHYRKYRQVYPESPYAWLAGIRAGQCADSLGDRAGALEAWRAAAALRGEPIGRVLGSAFLARSQEAAGEVEQARAAYADALENWDDGCGKEYELSRLSRLAANPFLEERLQPWRVTRDDLARRLGQIDASLKRPGGRELERGRWLLQQERWRDAIPLLEDVARAHPDIDTGREAGELARQARLEQALALADADDPTRDVAAATAALRALASERSGLVPAVATIALACQAGLDGRAAEARALLRDGLERWQQRQPGPPAPAAPGALEQDVSAIRAAVFRPLGLPAYRDRNPNEGPWAGRWNGFDWPATLPVFVVVDPEVTVRLPDGSLRQLVLPQRFAGLDNVLLADRRMTALLTTVIERLGGSGKGKPGDVMETPNQPAGPSLDVMALLNEFFPMRQGHWGGWVLHTYPVIRSIEFGDDERTRARVAVEIGYSGGDLVLEKSGGSWTVVRLENKWVT